MSKHTFLPRHAMPILVLLILIGSLLGGCELANTSPAPSVSIFGGTAPVVYSLSGDNNVVKISVDRSAEGVVLTASLDEYEMPTAWAKVGHPGNYYLYDAQKDPEGTDSADFLLAGDGSTYYAKKIQVGIDTGAKIFDASVSGNSVVYTYTSDTETITLPNPSLSAASQKWYWEQMAAGNYAILDNSGTALPLLNYAKAADGTGDDAFTGVTKTNRWLKSANDPDWKSGRDAALAFCEGRILIGAETLAVAKSEGEWMIGVDNTEVAESWSFDTYLELLLDAYKTSGSDTTDADTGASEAW